MEGEEGTREEEKMEDTGNPSEEETGEEKMEEDVKKMEEPEEIEMGEPEEDKEEDSSLLEPGPGEEEEEEDDVRDQREEELLREEEEVSRDENQEVDEEKQEEMQKSDEEVLRDFVGTDYGPEIENEKQTLSELNIDSPKDNSMSDDDDPTTKVKCQAEANDSESYKTPSGSNSKSTKSVDGSTLMHLEESLDFILSSNITKVYNQEEEEVTAGEEKVDGAGGDGKGEVEFLEELKAGEGEREGRRDRREEDNEGSEGRGAPRWASKDHHYVKSKKEQG